MRSVLTIAIGAAALCAPAAASAQTDRNARAYDNIRQFEQTMRADDLARRLDNLEQRQKTEQNLQTLAPQRGPLVALDNPYDVPRYYAPSVVVPVTPAERAAQDKVRDAELAASNARLRAIAAQQRTTR